MPTLVKKVAKLEKKVENNPFCIVKHRETKKLNEKLNHIKKTKSYQLAKGRELAKSTNQTVMVYQYKTVTKKGTKKVWCHMSLSAKINLHKHFSKMEILKIVKVNP